MSASSSPGFAPAAVEKPVVVTFSFVVSGSTLTSTTISNPVVVKTVKSQWASILGVSSASVYVLFVTDLATGVVSGPYGPNDAINQGKRRRLSEIVKDNGSGPLGERIFVDKARITIRRALATSGISVGMAVNLASSSGNPSDDVALVKAHSITNIANNAALASSVFGPIADSVAGVSGTSAANFNFKVDESSVAVSNLQRDIVVTKVEPLDPGIQAAIIIFVIIGSMMLYIYVLKPLRIRFHSFLSKHISCLKTLTLDEVKVAPVNVSQGLAASVSPSEAQWVMAPIDEVRLASERGNAGAQAQLGRRMLYGVGGCEKDPRGAAEWLERAARSKQREKRRVIIQSEPQTMQVSPKTLYSSSQNDSIHVDSIPRVSGAAVNSDLENRADNAIRIFEAADAEIEAHHLNVRSDSSATMSGTLDESAVSTFSEGQAKEEEIQVVQRVIQRAENGKFVETNDAKSLFMEFTPPEEESEDIPTGAFRKPKSVASDAELRQRADLAQRRLRESGLGSISK